jgi:hypothetical protein
MGNVQYVETPESRLKLRFMKILDTQLPETGPVAVELLAKELILAIPEPAESLPTTEEGKE